MAHPPTPVAPRAVLASSISRHAALEATLTCAHIEAQGVWARAPNPSWSDSVLEPLRITAVYSLHGAEMLGNFYYSAGGILHDAIFGAPRSGLPLWRLAG